MNRTISLSGAPSANVPTISQHHMSLGVWLTCLPSQSPGYGPSGLRAGNQLIAGNPGLGKSQTTLAMVAAVTTGGRWPDGTAAPSGSVILVSCEDDATDTIDRLEAAGADVSRVHLLDWVVERDQAGTPRRHFDVGKHTAALASLIDNIGDVRLVVIDPITAYMGAADSHKTADVRSALAPLQSLAAENGVAIILVSHLNKNGADGTAMNRVVGSGAYVAVCRSAWLVADDPQNTWIGRRILTPLKNNIGDDKTGFAFSVEGVVLPDGIKTSRVVFEREPVIMPAAELLRGQEDADEDRGAVGEACDFLREYLADGPKTTKSVQKDAKAARHRCADPEACAAAARGEGEQVGRDGQLGARACPRRPRRSTGPR